MLSFLNFYWSILNRDLSLRDENQSGSWKSVIETIPYFLHYTICWSSLFSLLFVVVPYVTSITFPRWFSSLEPRKRREYPSYVVCLVHHLALVPLAWYLLFQDINLSESEFASFNYINAIGYVGPFCIGYLVSDTIFFALPELLLHQKFEYICHHVLSIYLVISTMTGPSPFCKFIPHLLICDTTNILFNTA
jgi:hypothetical protein